MLYKNNVASSKTGRKIFNRKLNVSRFVFFDDELLLSRKSLTTFSFSDHIDLQFIHK